MTTRITSSNHDEKKRPVPSLLGVFIDHLFPYLDGEALYLLGACSRKLRNARLIYLALPADIARRCICKSIKKCHITCDINKHKSYCVSKGQPCRAIHHECRNKESHKCDRYCKCTCIKCLNTRRTRSLPYSISFRKRDRVNCGCVMCCDTRKKWFNSCSGRDWQSSQKIGSNLIWSILPDGTWQGQLTEHGLWLKEKERLENEEKARIAERQQQYDDDLRAKERQRLITKHGYTEKYLDENKCEFGLCGDGKECYSCETFFCAWRVYENICLECEEEEIREGLRSKEDEIYRP